MSVSAKDRFFSHIEKTPTGCWEWKGARQSNGYGQFSDFGSHLAHRWSYQTFIGPIRDSLHIDHLCRNRACVNPQHLELVTCRENLMRGVGFAATNAQKTHCDKGHQLSEIRYTAERPEGRRYCRACRQDYKRKSRKKLRAMSVQFMAACFLLLENQWFAAHYLFSNIGELYYGIA